MHYNIQINIEIFYFIFNLSQCRPSTDQTQANIITQMQISYLLNFSPNIQKKIIIVTANLLTTY
jgi:hypothetical protein